jgi:hypothetical protein
MFSISNIKFSTFLKAPVNVVKNKEINGRTQLSQVQLINYLQVTNSFIDVAKIYNISQDKPELMLTKLREVVGVSLQKVEIKYKHIEQINNLFSVNLKYKQAIVLQQLILNQDKNIKKIKNFLNLERSHNIQLLGLIEKFDHSYLSLENAFRINKLADFYSTIKNGHRFTKLLQDGINTKASFVLKKLTKAEQEYYYQESELKNLALGDSDMKKLNYFSVVIKESKEQNALQVLGKVDLNNTSIINHSLLKDQTREKNIAIDDSIRDTQSFQLLEVLETENHWLTWEQRWWFLKALNPADYKILPKDIVYPLDFDLINEPFPNKRVIEFEQSFQQTGRFELKIFDSDYNRLLTLDENIFNDISYNENDIQLEVDYLFKPNGFSLKWKIVDYSGKMSHLFLSHPKDQYGKNSTYALTQHFYDKKHPIPFGHDMGLKEIPIPLNIMADFLNILLMIWTKLFHAYTGFTGYKAVANLVSIVYDWLVLNTSQENESIQYYERCYRWLRWEAESILQECKTDPHLRGNYWVEKLIYELIDYMESHHVDYLPVWEDLIKMDEQRNIFNDPTLDMEVTLAKVKGIRHKVIENNRR